ncbi:MAG: protein kinase [Holophagales bacterium]|nr:protein kinase [Holophagales bacterium]
MTTVTSGSRLGSYEITGKLGEGGMGEVWRATDSKLKRDVAIKVLPAEFTDDRERLARFEREGQLLAQLHHPNIASIFGLEESDGTRALVMELVEGPTLAERMKTGHLLLEESLSIARQIAEALEEAHEKGIVHRDLKPQNVKAPVEGKVKVLDFGLAKAMDPPGSSSAADLGRSPTLMNSPTMTAAGTQLGVILGTAAYMSPEQARGGAVDKRADIWAFGVVLYEMLTGRSLFAAETVSDTLAGVLKTEVDFNALPQRPPGASPAPPPLSRAQPEEPPPRHRRRADPDRRVDRGSTRRRHASVCSRDGARLHEVDRGLGHRPRRRRWSGCARGGAGGPQRLAAGRATAALGRAPAEPGAPDRGERAPGLLARRAKPRLLRARERPAEPLPSRSRWPRIGADSRHRRRRLRLLLPRWALDRLRRGERADEGRRRGRAAVPSRRAAGCRRLHLAPRRHDRLRPELLRRALPHLGRGRNPEAPDDTRQRGRRARALVADPFPEDARSSSPLSAPRWTSRGSASSTSRRGR